MSKIKKAMLILLTLIVVVTLAIYIFLQQPIFGSKPSSSRLARISKSPNYKDGQFVNQSPTVMMTEGASYINLMLEQFSDKIEKTPLQPLPSIKRDLNQAPGAEPCITWFGHSSYLLQIHGLNILVDPVFSGYASPVNFSGAKSFAGTDVYEIEDLPPIDLVLISHDHYDHLDYKSILKLIPKTKHFIAPLGAGAHLERWGVQPVQLTELDWHEHKEIFGLTLTAAPARHFSGRGITDRNKTLWTSYIFQADTLKIYVGGDSGYDTHFKKIGNEYGPFDLVILESGQYNRFWKYIHMMPEETVQASIDLKGKVLLPVHWGKFKLGLHPWREPIERVVKEADRLSVQVTTPMIGEKWVISSEVLKNQWWK